MSLLMVFHEPSIFLQIGATPTNVVGFLLKFGHLVIGIFGILHLDTSTWLAWELQVQHVQTGRAMFPFSAGNRSTNGVVVSEGVWRPNFGQHIEISRTIL